MLFERQSYKVRRRNTELFYWLNSNDCNCQGWTRLKPGVKELPLGLQRPKHRYRAQARGPFAAAFQGALAGKGIGSGAANTRTAACMDTSNRGSSLARHHSTSPTLLKWLKTKVIDTECGVIPLYNAITGTACISHLEWEPNGLFHVYP